MLHAYIPAHPDLRSACVDAAMAGGAAGLRAPVEALARRYGVNPAATPDAAALLQPAPPPEQCAAVTAETAGPPLSSEWSVGPSWYRRDRGLQEAAAPREAAGAAASEISISAEISAEAEAEAA